MGDQREELQGFVEAWRDDAASCREESDPDRADCYDECAEEIEAFLKRQAAATPAGPPPAADTVGERRIIRSFDGWGVVENPDHVNPRVIAAGLSRSDAELLCSGPRMAALEAALRDLIRAAEVAGPQLQWGYMPEPMGGPTLEDVVKSARAALGAAGPGGDG